MAEELAQLDGVGTVLDRLGGEGVPEGVHERAGGYGAADAGAVVEPLDQVLDLAAGDSPSV